MKISRTVLTVIVFLIAVLGNISSVDAQDKKAKPKDSAIINMLDSQQYVFHAQYATPMSGRQKYLTSDYTVIVSKDTIVSDLPYFGRTYTAPINPGEAGIKFTSTDFEYKSTPRKKGGWDVNINLKDVTDPRQLIMTIFENGSASLQVSSNNRQPISFSGEIMKAKRR